jgi:hypothetical protein
LLFVSVGTPSHKPSSLRFIRVAVYTTGISIRTLPIRAPFVLIVSAFVHAVAVANCYITVLPVRITQYHLLTASSLACAATCVTTLSLLSSACRRHRQL